MQYFDINFLDFLFLASDVFSLTLKSNGALEHSTKDGICMPSESYYILNLSLLHAS